MANKLIFNQYFFTNGIEKTERKNVENLEDVVNSNIHTSSMIGFHNRFHQRIDALNERYTNNEIGLQVLLDGLSTVVSKQHN